jgi:hypothetical protein
MLTARLFTNTTNAYFPRVNTKTSVLNYVQPGLGAVDTPGADPT